jgi:hypothetical protein
VNKKRLITFLSIKPLKIVRLFLPLPRIIRVKVLILNYKQSTVFRKSIPLSFNLLFISAIFVLSSRLKKEPVVLCRSFGSLRVQKSTV